jgi:glyoxylase-like metal-dependent hydrolase (beta-lactamase superfamily II)
MTASEWTGPFRRRLGDLELTVVTDRTYHLDGGAFFGVVPKVMWSKRAPSDDANRIRCGLNSLVIRNGRETVLVETGCGDKLDEKQMSNWGVDPRRDYLDRLAAAGIAPDTVDVVVNTHLHYDHCGWNTVRDAAGRVRAAFPRARYHVQRQEWEHAREQHERDRVSYLSPNYDPLVESGQMELLQGDRTLTAEVAVRVLPGHTRGMQAVVISSRGETACYISDLMPTHWHLNPTWVMAFDLYPLETIDNKRRILESIVREHWLLVFTHDPETPWGYVERRDSKFEFVPAT